MTRQPLAVASPPRIALPREVLKWLQSLDLSMPIQHPQRDFNNGVVLAEIINRYYPGALSVNLFYSGQSKPQRMDNWAQLLKTVRRLGLRFDEHALQALARGDGDCVAIVLQAYTLLTKRRLVAIPTAAGSKGTLSEARVVCAALLA